MLSLHHDGHTSPISAHADDASVDGRAAFVACACVVALLIAAAAIAHCASLLLIVPGILAVHVVWGASIAAHQYDADERVTPYRVQP